MLILQNKALAIYSCISARPLSSMVLYLPSHLNTHDLVRGESTEWIM